MKTRGFRSMQIHPIGWLLVLGLWVGCATPPTAHREPAFSSWTGRDSYELPEMPARRPDILLPAAITAAERPDTAITEEDPASPLPTEKISDMDLVGVTDVVTILRTMARAAGVNILISPNVAGELNFTFHDVPWDHAFRAVIASAGLTYMWEGEILRVMTVEDITAELNIESVRREREKIRAELREAEPLHLQVFPIHYVRARGVGETVRILLVGPIGEVRETLWTQRANVTVDEENNAIVVHATRADLLKAHALISELDQPRPQIHIEARIVEATRDTARQLGVQWGGQVAGVQGNRLMTLGGPGMTADGFASSFPAQFAQGVEPPVGFSLGFISEKFGASEVLNMQLTALQRAGQIQILSSPSITTLNNEKAVIESGEERAYRVTTGTGNILDVSLEWKKAVLKLEVTPSVVDGEHLRIEIVANKDSFDETRPQTNNEFPVNTKHARTMVMLRDGQTVVIGGLSQESKSTTASGVPVLMDIPIIGHLFKNTGKATKFEDTLIFITPTIIRPGA